MFNIEIINPQLGNIQFIFLASGEWFLILNKKAWNVCLLLHFWKSNNYDYMNFYNCLSNPFVFIQDARGLQKDGFSLHLLSYKKKLTKILFHPRPWKDFLGRTFSQRSQVYLFFFEMLWHLTVTKISKCCHNDFLITKWSFNKVEDEPIKENMKKINIQIVWR